MESESAGADPSPINLVDCGLEELVSALLAGQPIEIPSGGKLFVLSDDDARRILSYYTRHRDLWPRAKAVQAREIEDILKALAGAAPAATKTKSAATTSKQLWKLRRLEAHRFGGFAISCHHQGSAHNCRQ